MHFSALYNVHLYKYKKGLAKYKLEYYLKLSLMLKFNGLEESTLCCYLLKVAFANCFLWEHDPGTFDSTPSIQSIIDFKSIPSK